MDYKYSNDEETFGPAVQWAVNGNVYKMSGEVSKTLPPGAYDCTIDSWGNGVLTKMDLKLDELVRFPNTIFNDVLTRIKQFWTRRSRYHDFGFLHRLGYLLHGPQGCLSANTKIQYENRNSDGTRRSKKTVSIARFHQIFNRTPVKGKGLYHIAPSDTDFWISSADDEGRIFKNRVVDVVFSGVKECFRITTSTGRTIDATADHPFLSGGKFIQLDKLKVGDFVDVHNNTLIRWGMSNKKTKAPSERRNRKYLYLKHHPLAREKKVNGYQYKVVPLSRAVIEAEMNQMPLEEYKKCLNQNRIENMRFLSKNDDVHHIDEDCSNDALNNLQVISHSEHARKHINQHPLTYVTTEEQIVSIEPTGQQNTYDIKMEAPYHNFVADGFVVHNCGKSSLIYQIMDSIISDGHLCLMCQHRVSSFIECVQNVRIIEPDRPMVCVIEDIDTHLSNGENQLLQWLDGINKTDHIVVIATTNYPEQLDRRIVCRPRRFDRVMYIGLPDTDMRRTYFANKLKNGDDLDLDIWVAVSEGLSFAGLAELVISVCCMDNDLFETAKLLKVLEADKPDSKDFLTKLHQSATDDAEDSPVDCCQK